MDNEEPLSSSEITSKKIKETRQLQLMNGDIIEEEISEDEQSVKSDEKSEKVDKEETLEAIIKYTLLNLANFVVESVI